MQKTVGIASLRPSLEGSACKASLWLVFELRHLTCSLRHKGSPLCFDHSCKQCDYAEHLFTSGNLEQWHMSGRGHLCDHTPAKFLGAESLMGSLGRNISHGITLLVSGERSIVRCTTSEEREDIDFSAHIFSSYDPTLYPYYMAIINHSQEYIF